MGMNLVYERWNVKKDILELRHQIKKFVSEMNIVEQERMFADLESQISLLKYMRERVTTPIDAEIYENEEILLELRSSIKQYSFRKDEPNINISRRIFEVE